MPFGPQYHMIQHDASQPGTGGRRWAVPHGAIESARRLNRQPREQERAQGRRLAGSRSQPNQSCEAIHGLRIPEPLPVNLSGVHSRTGAGIG